MCILFLESDNYKLDNKNITIDKKIDKDIENIERYLNNLYIFHGI